MACQAIGSNVRILHHRVGQYLVSNKFPIFLLTNTFFLVKMICIRKICAMKPEWTVTCLTPLGDANWQTISRPAEPCPPRIIDRRTVPAECLWNI